jgi:hypothetical protein
MAPATVEAEVARKSLRVDSTCVADRGAWLWLPDGNWNAPTTHETASKPNDDAMDNSFMTRNWQRQPHGMLFFL